MATEPARTAPPQKRDAGTTAAAVETLADKFDLLPIKKQLQGTWLVGGVQSTVLPQVWHIQGSRVTVVGIDGNRIEKPLALVAPCRLRVGQEHRVFVMRQGILHTDAGRGGLRIGNAVVACFENATYVLKQQTCTGYDVGGRHTSAKPIRCAIKKTRHQTLFQVWLKDKAGKPHPLPDRVALRDDLIMDGPLRRAAAVRFPSLKSALERLRSLRPHLLIPYGLKLGTHRKKLAELRKNGQLHGRVCPEQGEKLGPRAGFLPPTYLGLPVVTATCKYDDSGKLTRIILDLPMHRSLDGARKLRERVKALMKLLAPGPVRTRNKGSNEWTSWSAHGLRIVSKRHRFSHSLPDGSRAHEVTLGLTFAAKAGHRHPPAAHKSLRPMLRRVQVYRPPLPPAPRSYLPPWGLRLGMSPAVVMRRLKTLGFNPESMGKDKHRKTGRPRSEISSDGGSLWNVAAGRVFCIFTVQELTAMRLMVGGGDTPYAATVAEERVYNWLVRDLGKRPGQGGVWSYGRMRVKIDTQDIDHVWTDTIVILKIYRDDHVWED